MKCLDNKVGLISSGWAMENLNFKNRNILVCGASDGIGKKTAQLFASGGAQVALLARNEDKLKATLSELPGEGHCIFAVDLSKVDELAQVCSTIKSKFGAVDTLICNSGGPKAGPLIKAAPDEFTAGFQQHIVANQILLQAFTPEMIENNFGRIVNIISTSVKIPIFNLGVSNTIRGAVASWAKSMANELGSHNITINNVLPGYTKTGRLEKLITAAGKRLDKSEADIEKLWKAKVPMGRFAEVEEVAGCVTFLASSMASYVNGVSLPVDGGRTGCL